LDRSITTVLGMTRVLEAGSLAIRHSATMERQRHRMHRRVHSAANESDVQVFDSGMENNADEERVQQEPAPMDTADDPRAVPTARLVLIADDEAPIAEALAMIIETLGYSTVIAQHGEEARRHLRCHAPGIPRSYSLT
jgi:PleD family two-component response regulator